jgi:PucR-like helix-turn-helix protein/diguanylate cyclase with GGDEF domain
LTPELSQRLRARRDEIEAAMLARVRSVEDPGGARDARYLQGLKGTVGAAIAEAIMALEGDQDRVGPLSQELIVQARLAARSGVALDTVLRRYLVGYTLLCDYVLEEGGEAPASSLRRALRAEGALLDRIAVAVAGAYKEEVGQRHRTTEQRRAEHARRLLAGEPQDTADLGYDLDLWHIGVLASGSPAPTALRQLATALDRRLLLVRPGGSEIWGWLGGHRKLAAKELVEHARDDARPDLLLAIGEPGCGIAGWRLTHRQAKAALSVAQPGASDVVSYSDVAILASVLGDDVLTSSLSELYLAPLAAERDGGAALRETLRAYFAAGRNAASTAAVLGVSRQTVNARLNAVEERIGSQLNDCGREIETALQLWDHGIT